MARMGIVVVAALMVEVISVVQYRRTMNMMGAEMDTRARIVLGSVANEIAHMLELTESTMRENLWLIRRNLHHPDSAASSIRFLIDDNPHVVGGCLAFVPGYYPSKGRLYEPYGKKVGGEIVLEQIGGENHDYTQNSSFAYVLGSGRPQWSDPYRYGPDSLSLATFSYPVRDRSGRIAAVCGLDIDLTWLGDTLNTNLPYESTFGLLLTREGNLVAGPSPDKVSPALVREVLEEIKGGHPASRELFIRTARLERAPEWQIARVYRVDEVMAKMRKMRLQLLLMVLLGLGILAFMINRYARNERNLRLSSEEQARLSGELAVAAGIQHAMLPTSFPSYLYGTVEPAREVGGDLFDYFTKDGKLFFCIGDVAGKGVPSAMLMSVIHSLFRMVSRRYESPSQILRVLNKELCQQNDSGMFVTFFAGCLDLYSGELFFSNAGHDKPFVISDEITLLPTKANLPLGVFPDTVFEEQRMTLSSGTTLLLYTDGLTESKDSQRKLFGREGVLKALEGALAVGLNSPRELISALSSAAHRFSGDVPQSDDLTLLVLRFEKGELLREQITLSNDTSRITELGAFIKDYLGWLDLDRKTLSGIRLALEESVVNVMNYAYPAGETGSVQVLADSNFKEVRFTVLDSGRPFDPTSVLEADTTLDAQNRPVGGLGIHLTRSLMDSISYCRRDGQNILTLTKSI